MSKSFSKLFHKHKWKPAEVWHVSVEDDMNNPTYQNLKTQAIGSICKCGTRKVETFHSWGSKCDLHEIHVNNQRRVIEWLNN